MGLQVFRVQGSPCDFTLALDFGGIFEQLLVATGTLLHVQGSAAGAPPTLKCAAADHQAVITVVNSNFSKVDMRNMGLGLCSP